METFEHLSTKELSLYFDKLRVATTEYLFVSIPVEKVVIAVGKDIIKRLLFGVDEHYTLKELWYTLLGKLDKVERVELGHKGFDYDWFLEQLSQHFNIVRIDKIPWSVIKFSICLVAKPIPLR